MKVIPITPLPWQAKNFGCVPELYLEAENDHDSETLERIERNYVTIGCGRVGDDLKMRHVRIALTPTEEPKSDV
jgi:hypothetical protein